MMTTRISLAVVVLLACSLLFPHATHAQGSVVHDVPPAAGPTVKDDDQKATGEPAPAPAPEEFSPEMIRLRNKIRTCLSYYYQRPTSVNERSPWGIMHSLISFGVDTELLAGNQRVNAIGWLCYNRPCKGMTLMTIKNGRLVTAQRSGLPGSRRPAVVHAGVVQSADHVSDPRRRSRIHGRGPGGARAAQVSRQRVSSRSN